MMVTSKKQEIIYRLILIPTNRPALLNGTELVACGPFALEFGLLPFSEKVWVVVMPLG